MEDMQSDDRVLVAYVPKPIDFQRVQQHGWYRIPMLHAPKGIYAEWIAFYFGRAFGEEKHAVHFYAPLTGHELVTRRMLLPDEPDHPRANDVYYKLQVGPVRRLKQPIVSLRWRRVLFIHTTGDRFRDAVELKDLLIDGEGYVDRTFTTLRDDASQPYQIRMPL